MTVVVGLVVTMVSVVGGAGLLAAPFVAVGMISRRWTTQVGGSTVDLVVNGYGPSRLLVDGQVVAASASRGWLRAVVDGHQVDAFTGEGRVALLVDGVLAAGRPLADSSQLPAQLPVSEDLEARRAAREEVARLARQRRLAS